MARFRYKALGRGGALIEGEMDATDEGAVVSHLQTLGCMVIRADRTAFRVGWPSLPSSPRHRIGADEITILTHGLSMLLQAGLPVDRALATLADLSDRPALRALLQRVLDRLRGGATLADALAAEGPAFPAHYVGLVRAGEVGATLEASLAQLAEIRDRGAQFRADIRSALIYPAFLLVGIVVSLVLMLGYVLPQFAPLFAAAEHRLPLSTRWLLSAGAVIRDYGWSIPLVLVGSLSALRLRMGNAAARVRLHRRLLRLPVVGGLLARAEVAHFASALAAMLASGIPLLSALSMARETLTNAALAADVAGVAEAVKQGRGLAEPLAACGSFPVLAVRLVRIGEESGALSTMLNRVADIHDREVRRAVQRLLSLLVPVVTLGMGLIIAFVMGSILAAIMEANQLAF